jgi:hypothetical protein
MVMAILYLKDSWRVDHPMDAYLIEEMQDNNNSNKKRIGYWRF